MVLACGTDKQIIMSKRKLNDRYTQTCDIIYIANGFARVWTSFLIDTKCLFTRIYTILSKFKIPNYFIV